MSTASASTSSGIANFGRIGRLLERQLERAVVRITLRRRAAGRRALGAERERLAARPAGPVDLDPRRNGWRALALSSAVDASAGRKIDRRRATGAASWRRRDRARSSATAPPRCPGWRTRAGTHRPAPGAVVSAPTPGDRRRRRARGGPRRRPTTTRRPPTSRARRTGASPVGVDAPPGGRKITSISASRPGSTETTAARPRRTPPARRRRRRGTTRHAGPGCGSAPAAAAPGRARPTRVSVAEDDDRIHVQPLGDARGQRPPVAAAEYALVAPRRRGNYRSCLWGIGRFLGPVSSRPRSGRSFATGWTACSTARGTVPLTTSSVRPAPARRRPPATSSTAATARAVWYRAHPWTGTSPMLRRAPRPGRDPGTGRAGVGRTSPPLVVARRARRPTGCWW